jgi:hypothetical protein
MEKSTTLATVPNDLWQRRHEEAISSAKNTAVAFQMRINKGISNTYYQTYQISSFSTSGVCYDKRGRD